MTREQLEISIQSNMPTNGVGYIAAVNTRQVANDLADYVDDEIDKIDVDVTGLEERITTAEGDIDNLETRMTTAEGDIDNLQDDVNTIPNNYYNKAQADDKFEILSNKATNFNTINDVLYPTTKAVADYVSSIEPGSIYYTDNNDTYQNVKNAIASGDLVIMKYLNGYLPLARVYNAGQTNEYYTFVGHFTNHSTMMIILNSSGWQTPESLALTTTITGYESADNLFPSVKAFVDWVNTKLDDYAKKDGYYETMGVGTANNLAGQTESIDNSKFRTSGGTTDIGTGTMRVYGVRGNSAIWNQLLRTRNLTNYGITLTAGSNNDVTFNGTASQNILKTSYFSPIQNFNSPEGHKFYIGDFNTNNKFTIQCIGLNYSGNWITLSPRSIISADNGIFRFSLIIDEGTSFDNEVYKMPNIVDLSLIYGTNKEPSSAAQFEADYENWFGKAIESGEPYNDGTISFAQDLIYKTVGFNLLNPSTGKAHLVGTYGNTNISQGLYCYEITGNYTSITDVDGNTITPSNGFFMVEDPQEITVEGADENTCIHLTWSGWRNGEVEPYQEHFVDMPVTQITGKLNGTGASTVIFPDGMRSAGDAYDEIYVNNNKVYAVKRIGTYTFDANSRSYVRLDNWRPMTNSYAIAFSNAMVNNLKVIYDVINYKMEKLEASMYGDLYNGKTGISTFSLENFSFFVRLLKSKASTADAVCNWLNGKTVYYELNTPEVYEVDNFELPIRTYINDFGTEEQLTDSVATNVVVKYAVNAVDLLRRLPENYISSSSMDNFLAALGTAMNGTWTKTWNSNNQNYTFSFRSN